MSEEIKGEPVAWMLRRDLWAKYNGYRRFADSRSDGLWDVPVYTSAQTIQEGWQPIETAPAGAMTLFCSMATGDVKKWAFVDWIAGGEFMMHPTWGATHWMPLPAAPK